MNIEKIKEINSIRYKNGKNDYYCNNKECINKKRQMIIQEKYGVDNVFQLNNIKKKIKETKINRQEKYYKNRINILI